MPKGTLSLPKKGGSIGDFLETLNGQKGWNLHLRRNPMESELAEVVDLLHCLESVDIGTGTDRLLWGAGTKENFSISDWNKTLEHQVKKRPTMQGT